MYFQIKITDITGKEWAGDKHQVTKEELDREFMPLTKIFEEFTNMTYFKMEMDRNILYFNPKNLICAEIVVEDE
jgi:hypothetical protein